MNIFGCGCKCWNSCSLCKCRSILKAIFPNHIESNYIYQMQFAFITAPKFTSLSLHYTRFDLIFSFILYSFFKCAKNVHFVMLSVFNSTIRPIASALVKLLGQGTLNCSKHNAAHTTYALSDRLCQLSATIKLRKLR